VTNLSSAAVTEAPRRPEPPSRRRQRLVAAGIAAVLVAALATAAAVVWHSRGDSRQLEGVVPPGSSSPAKVGVFRGTSLSEVKRYEQWLGRPVNYVVDFSTRDSWEEVSDPALLLDQWRGSGYRIVHGLAMLPEQDASATMEAGARGEYDHYYYDLGTRLVAGGQSDAILRLGWEFNLSTSRWRTDDPQVFVQYWRHVVSAMRAVPGQQFEFDWNVNNGHNAVDAMTYYPGDDVVDYVGVDVYDVSWANDTYPYPEGCDRACRTERQDNAWNDIFGDERGLQFWAAFAGQHGKPLSLPEWGLWSRPDGHGGGEDPSFVKRMHDFIDTHDIAYQSYFEYSAQDGPHRLMEGFPQSATVFKQLFGKAGEGS
jgi:hypothetical protein